jgi:UDP-N-acetylglucosamine 2-epimerase (non-hydrolysing)
MMITIVAGARPNFMKIAPIIKSINIEQAKGKNITYRLVHTGQHYDKKMSGDFFDQLGIPEPDVNLNAGGGSQAQQTAAIMVGIEKDLQMNRPDLVLVVGDVTSTMAASITAKKLCIDVAHVEAGIRSRDLTMPEEINRMVTDAITDHYFTTSVLANQNLLKEGANPNRIHFVGNTMIDTLFQNLDRLIEPPIWKDLSLRQNAYFLLTLHRPSNVDSAENLKKILDVILNGTIGYPVLFPVHPRTKNVLMEMAYENDRLVQMDPLNYLQFVYLIKNARAVITDSGGITEESTVLGIPCMTLRATTERPETVTIGTNELVGTDPHNLYKYFKDLQSGNWKKGAIPELWDGQTSSRIVSKLLSIYEKD